jgi:hypothetical protein
MENVIFLIFLKQQQNGLTPTKPSVYSQNNAMAGRDAAKS